MSRERGFSLVELLVAIVMTLIVSGAIYGLMASGQGSFKREPALIDRQQNIRVAMDLITRDLENAGSGMTGHVVPGNPDPGPPPLAQVFSTALNNVGPAGSAIVAGQQADALEALVIDGACPTLQVCADSSDATNLNLYVSAFPANGCMGQSVAVPGALSFFAYLSGPNVAAAGQKSLAATSNRTPGLLWVRSTANVNAVCNAIGGSRAHLAIPVDPTNPANPCPPGACQSVAKVSVVRYEIAGENPGQAITFTGVPLNPPCLWRSEYGLKNFDGTLNGGPNILVPAANNPWQMVARGIDDMQIQYQAGAAAFADTPPIVPVPAVDSDVVVRRVRITLSARAIGVQLGGESTYATNAGAEPGRRGQLTTIVTPRSALKTVAMDANPAKIWR